ncbi:MAG TPA: methyl-accepting chemotaxis protein [Oscillospiraceae bacterium]|nr:methyl-accepting chemotaxis protein [Oscillospiraceae bacterium]
MRSIKTKIMAAGLSIILIMGLVIGGAVSVIFYQNSLANMESILSSNATAYAQSIRNAVSVYKVQLENLASQSIITDDSLSISQKEAILAKEAKRSSFKDFSVAYGDGKTYSDTDISARDYFKEAMNGQTYISSPIIRLTDGSVTIMAATKVNNSTNFYGALYGGIYYTTFGELIDNIKISETGYAFIVDKNGSIIAHPDNNIVVDYATDAETAKSSDAGNSISGFVDQMTANETGNSTYTFNGVKRFVSYIPIEGNEGWSLAVTVEYDDMMSDFYTTLTIIILLTVVIMVLGAIGCIFIANGIANPIKKVTNRLELLSQGDLTSEVKAISNKDEVGKLSNSLTRTIENLNIYIGDISSVLGEISNSNLDIDVNVDYLGDFAPIKNALTTIVSALNETLRKVNETAINVNDGAQQVASNAQNLSQTTTEQAATVEELSSTVATIAEQIKISADNTRSANLLSSDVGIEIDKGNAHMKELLASMNDIDQSSQEISKIIKVIDDIAFQTNILALNAAVEAARAGAAGKGFAVVADEVRNLALKSAEAANTTTELIARSINSVGSGIKIADDTAKSMQVVVDKVSEVNKLVDEIAIATNEQAVSVDSINAGMAQIASVTQNNSATAEEGAASSDEMLMQSNDLKAIVDEFKLK